MLGMQIMKISHLAVAADVPYIAAVGVNDLTINILNGCLVILVFFLAE